MRLRTFFVLVLVFVLPLLAVSARADIFNTSAPTAATYAVIAQTLVSNPTTFGDTVITGDVGISPSGACTGFVPVACGSAAAGTISGAIHINDAIAGTALSNAEAAELALLATVSPAPISETGNVLGSGGSVPTLPPGIYTFSSTAQLTGTLTLTAFGDANPLWIFETGKTLTVGTTATPGSVVVTDTTGGAGIAAAGVYWVSGSDVILNPNAAMLGNMIAETNISFLPGAQDTCGRAFADTSVTFAGNNPAAAVPPTGTARPNLISNTCAQSTSGFNGGTIVTPPGGGPPFVTAPEPGTLALLSFGLLAMVFLTFRKSRVSPLSC